MKTRLVGFLYSTSLPRAGIFHASRLLRTKGRMRRTSREIFTHAIPAARKFPSLRVRFTLLRGDAVKVDACVSAQKY